MGNRNWYKQRKFRQKRFSIIAITAIIVLFAAGILVITWRVVSEIRDSVDSVDSVDSSNSSGAMESTTLSFLGDAYQGENCDTEQLRKGYDLSVSEGESQESETDCMTAMNAIQALYEEAADEKASQGVLSRDTLLCMQQKLQDLGNPVTVGDYGYNMCNYEAMDTFVNDCMQGQAGEIVTYELRLDGGIGRRKYIYTGEDLYVIATTASWNLQNESCITYITCDRIEEWDYTEDGWLSLVYCVPVYPEVTEEVNENVLIRIEPIEEEYLEIGNQYLSPLGYQGNNVLWSDWNQDNLADIDYNGLFEALYTIEYGQKMDATNYQNGIPKEEFESLITKYMPVTVEQLQEYAAYNQELCTYDWFSLGCGNYSPNAFETSEPLVTDICYNEDGTATLTVQAVCVLMGNENVLSHQVTVKFLEDGGIQYLGNIILDDADLPQYQNRYKSDSTESVN